MAPPAGQLRTGRYFAVLLAIVAILYALVFFTGSANTPRLGLDLIGGTTVTLTAQTTDGKPPTTENLEQARQIIERRVNGLGVAEAQVVTEGNSNIVISVPGNEGAQAKQLGQTAQLRFRPVIGAPQPVTATPSASATPTDPAAVTGSATPTDTGSATPTDTGSATPTDSAAVPTDSAATPTDSAAVPTDTAATPTDSAATPTPTGAAAVPTGPGTGTGVAPILTQDEATTALATLDCATRAAGAAPDDPTSYVAACSEDGTTKYLLGPTIIEGTDITNAAASLDTTNLQGWVVMLSLNNSGGATWGQYTAAHVQEAVAFTLDGQVVSAPTIQGAIVGVTQITGNFTQDTATSLANSLKYGSLPLTFSQSEANTVSATLGLQQLEAGLIAGGIGVVLVFVYALLYYRLLGLVTIASLLLSGVVTYAVLVVLGRQIGFTLSLAGIAGFIVAIGITADSFVVFFERIKDEVHEGRSMRSAVPRAWVRARRTILSADAVSFLAAAILYYLAIGEVKGFAFTLGLSTVLDLVVVFLFTHPIVSVLSRGKAFGSPRVSGLGRARAGVTEIEPATSAVRERAAARRRAAGSTAVATPSGSEG